MCGIAAIAARDARRTAGTAELDAMVARLVHRGPDDEGAAVLPGGALGMRRLAIIDVAGGHQPFSNEDGTVVVVANGQLYNFEQVKRELIARGHVFHTRCDIEILPHAYEEWGDGFLSRVHGMFALALWDAKARRLIAARDRAGEKPLYYAETGEGLLLASEIKSLLAHPATSRELDPVALDQFLTYEYVITPRTIFRHIKRLPPAHRLTWSEGRLGIERYWDAADVPLRRWSDAEAAEALRAALGEAVSAQMMSDVPLGVFLSGGIDSSAIVALMSEAAAARGAAVNSFSMGFEDGSYNELPYARVVASHFLTNHREATVSPRLEDLFERLVPHFDEPFADVSLFPTFLVSEMARRHVTVALAGDGGDELFGGYDAYEAQALAARIARFMPRGAAGALHRLASVLPPSEKKKGLVNKVKRFVEGVAQAPADIAQYRWMTFLDPRAKRRLYSDGLRDALAGADVYAPVREALGRGGDDDLNRQLYADLSIYLADDILVKVDRMSMASSLETRAPFLDVNVMELAFSMPGHLKIRDGQRKFVLKQALEGLLPASILARSKEGFSIPMKQWLRRDLAPLMRELLSREQIGRHGLFEQREIERRIAEHLAGRQNHAHVLFSLMVFERWAQASPRP
jgi:asparagine synthase (glutamine-hydrolysing)